MILDNVAVVPGIDGRKMSKSYGNTIDIFGAEKPIRKAIMSIITDSTPVEEPKPTEGSTLYQLARVFAPEGEREWVETTFREGGTGYGTIKKQLFEWFRETFGPARARFDELKADPDAVEAILVDGARRAREEIALSWTKSGRPWGFGEIATKRHEKAKKQAKKTGVGIGPHSRALDFADS